jgi:serine/threonine protein kinase
MAGTYNAPDWMSPAAKDLLSRMLTVDPERRATLAEVAAHPWTRGSGPQWELPLFNCFSLAPAAGGSQRWSHLPVGSAGHRNNPNKGTRSLSGANNYEAHGISWNTIGENHHSIVAYVSYVLLGICLLSFRCSVDLLSRLLDGVLNGPSVADVPCARFSVALATGKLWWLAGSS